MSDTARDETNINTEPDACIVLCFGIISEILTLLDHCRTISDASICAPFDIPHYLEEYAFMTSDGHIGI